MRVAAVLRLAQDAHVLQGDGSGTAEHTKPRLRGRIAVCGPVGLGPAQRRLEARRSSRARGSGIPAEHSQDRPGEPRKLGTGCPTAEEHSRGARPVIMAR